MIVIYETMVIKKLPLVCLFFMYRGIFFFSYTKVSSRFNNLIRKNVFFISTLFILCMKKIRGNNSQRYTTFQITKFMTMFIQWLQQ